MKRKTVVVGAAVLASAGLGIWFSRPVGPREPVYQGKALSAWLDDRRATPQGPVVLSDQAVAAVRAIGPAAVPTLLAWLRASDSSFSRSAKILLEWRLKLPVRVPTNQDKRMRAMYGFRALGSAASAAFPELVAIALDSPDEWQRGDAINALTDSDADTMRRIAGSLKSPDREVRLRAVFALSCIRIAPDEVCLPALEGAQSDPDPQVRTEAAKGIAVFDHQLKVFVALLTHRDSKMRALVARQVGSYRTRARAFLSDLEAAAGDNDPEVRAAVAEAIQRVRGSESPPTH
ncbi:MAG: HEAT repeat domain-containing protein [Isosphaeraceae bacterium]